jgi:teichuronic acid exporter
MSNNTISKKAALNALLWDMTGLIAGRGIIFIVSIFLARLLTPNDFGLIAVLMAFIGLSQMLYEMGFSSALVQSKKVSKTQYSTVFYINLIISTVLTIILFCSASYIADFYDEPELKVLSKVISFVFILTALNSVQNARLSRRLDFKTQTKSQVLSSLTSGTIAIILGYSGYGVWALVFQVLFNALLNLFITWHLTRWLPLGAFRLSSIYNLWRFGKNIFLSSLLESLSQRLDYLIVGKLFSTDSLGFYFRAKSLQVLVASLSSSSLMKVLLPTISRIQDDKTRIKKMYHLLNEILLFAILLLTGLLYINAKEIFIILFGEQWLKSIPLFKILILSVWATPISTLMLNIMKGSGNSTHFLKAEILKKVIRIVPFLLAFGYGLNQMLWGFAVASFISVLINLYFIKKAISINIIGEFITILKYVLLAITPIIILQLLHIIEFSNFFNLILKSFIYLLIYNLLHYVFNRHIYKSIISLKRD